jgi:hypothetical protein
MTRTRMLAILCILEVAFATAAFGKSRHSAAPPAQDATQVKRVPTWRGSGFILRQDLFDRQNPNNIRSDWPAPPAQPGQF